MKKLALILLPLFLLFTFFQTQAQCTNPPPQPSAISGNPLICYRASQTYSVTPVSGATSYSWRFPTGWTGSSTTNSITVTIPSTGNGGSIFCHANNGCGQGGDVTLLVITTPPAPLGTMSGNTTLCAGQKW